MKATERDHRIRFDEGYFRHQQAVKSELDTATDFLAVAMDPASRLALDMTEWEAMEAVYAAIIKAQIAAKQALAGWHDSEGAPTP